MRLLISFWFLLVAFLSVGFIQTPEPPTPCSEAYLDEALRRGGTTVFECSHPITVYSNKAVTKDTTLIGVGDAVIFNGLDSTSNLFYILEGVSFSIHNVGVFDSRNFGVLMSPDSHFYGADCLFAWHGSDDTNGVAVWNEGGTVHVNNCTFEHTQNGTAIINEAESVLEVSNSSFRANILPEEHGAAIQNSGTATITHSEFYDNTTGAAVANLAGEMFVTNSHFYRNDTGLYNAASIEIADSSFSNNAASEEGRGIINEGAASLSSTYIQNNPRNCDGEFSDLGGNYQSDNDSCGATITVEERRYPIYETVVTAFSDSGEYVSTENGMYTVSLFWMTYALPVTQFRVILDPINLGSLETLVVPVTDEDVEMHSALIENLNCGGAYLVYVEALSDDRRVVWGRSYNITIATPSCG